MADQEDLFGGVRRDDPMPSYEAAARVDVARLEQVVLNALIAHGAVYPADYWLTVLQLEALLKRRGIDKWSISPRLSPLEAKGLVERREMPGLNSSGKLRNLTHWRATAKAKIAQPQ